MLVNLDISYADPAGDNLDGIQDIEGNDAPSFTNLMVTNNSLEDVTPPELDSASVAEDGEHILLTFNELVSFLHRLIQILLLLRYQAKPGQDPMS